MKMQLRYYGNKGDESVDGYSFLDFTALLVETVGPPASLKREN